MRRQAQRHRLSCLRLHSWEVVKPRLELRHLAATDWVPNAYLILPVLSERGRGPRAKGKGIKVF